MEQLNNNHSFNLKQRDMFAKLLAQAKTRVQAEVENDYSANQKIDTEVATKLAEEYGATELIAKIQKLHTELGEVESALRKIGFEYENERVSIYYKAPKALEEALEAAKRAAKEERNNVLKKYDRAILSVWAAETAKEAKKIVEELL